MKSLTSLGLVVMLSLLMLGCGGISTSGEEGNEELDNAIGVLRSELSEVPGCHFYVDSNYGGKTLHMPRGTTIANLRDYSMGDKISSVRLRGGATTRMWMDDTYRGSSWFIGSDVYTFHTSGWGRLGDNQSSVDCY